MNKAVRNERRKLTATYFNGIAIALFAIGGLAPAAGLLQGLTSSRTTTIALIVICIVLSGALHLAARAVLGGIEE